MNKDKKIDDQIIRTKVVVIPVDIEDTYQFDDLFYANVKENGNDKYQSAIFTITKPERNFNVKSKFFNDKIIEDITAEIEWKEYIKNIKKHCHTKEKLVEKLKELYVVKDDTVYILLIQGHVQGFDYGGCLNTCSNENSNNIRKYHNIYFLSLDSFDKLNDPVNRCFSIRKYILIAIYRDVIRFKLQERFTIEKGNRRCIFTISDKEELNNAIFAIKFPTISRIAEQKINKICKLKNIRVPLGIKEAKRELRKLRPVYWIDRQLLRLQNKPLLSIILGVLLQILVGVLINFLSLNVTLCEIIKKIVDKIA